MKGWKDVRSVVSCQLLVGARREARAARSEERRSAEPSAFRLPPSPFRPGLSLTEVLIAMGILTLGLLGVASVFPVGGYYMQQAEIKDHASAIAQSVMSDIMARGMLNPRSWYVMVPDPSTRRNQLWNIAFLSDSK